MLVSEAMRKGAKMGRQLKCTFGHRDGSSCGVGAVALGSGLVLKEHLGETITNDLRKALRSVFPDLAKPMFCPACRGQGGHVDELFVHLNDYHQWTRERMAGWIETHIETPTYSLLDMQHYMKDPEEAPKEAACVGQ